jgi:hypothetical protein
VEGLLSNTEALERFVSFAEAHGAGWSGDVVARSGGLDEI